MVEKIKIDEDILRGQVALMIYKLEIIQHNQVLVMEFLKNMSDYTKDLGNQIKEIYNESFKKAYEKS